MAFKKVSILLLFLALFSIIAPSAFAQQDPIDIVYFYGSSCPHCQNFEEWLDEIKDDYSINPVGYEVYSNEENRELAIQMAKEYGESFKGVPMIFVDDQVFIGFSESSTAPAILQKIDSCINEECCNSPLETVKLCKAKDIQKEKVTFASVMILAFADSLNPCALAVLALALIALLAHDPTKKKRVLLGGFAFISAVFITYMIYGGIIIQFFKFIQTSFAFIGSYVRTLFAALAILIGILNLKDFFKHKSGSFAIEMPVRFRPMMKKVISSITSPGGAFIIGIFVTLFLLPCTIGPYLVVGNILSGLAWVKSLPWLILYNIIFVLPMVVVTLLVYFGMKKVDDVTGWKDKNIKWLHLVAGIVILLLGLAMLFGFV
jgi:cytochrome c biogenesis protein CcdA/glutaredoxin